MKQEQTIVTIIYKDIDRDLMIPAQLVSKDIFKSGEEVVVNLRQFKLVAHLVVALQKNIWICH